MYYTYVYSNEQGVAYYVGKGQGGRAFWRADGIPVPNKSLIQTFEFETDTEACDTEIQLIALWGRITDGGTLMNKTLGGRGTTGLVMSDEVKEKHRKAMNKRLKERGHPMRGKVGELSHRAKRYLITRPDDTEVSIVGLRNFCHQNGLTPSALWRVANGRQTKHKGYKAAYLD